MKVSQFATYAERLRSALVPDSSARAPAVIEQGEEPGRAHLLTENPRKR
jgi:hypothetical protein